MARMVTADDSFTYSIFSGGKSHMHTVGFLVGALSISIMPTQRISLEKDLSNKIMNKSFGLIPDGATNVTF